MILTEVKNRNMSRKFNCRDFCLTTLFLLLACGAPLDVSAQTSELEIPAEVKPFVEKGAAAIAFESADLNGDGTTDLVLVTEPLKPEATSDEDNGDERTLLIIVRDRAGKLTLAKHNDKVVYCKSCGGVFGDPFAGIEVKRKGFIVNNYGGSNWRWSESYEFGYSRLDKTWQLVRAVEEAFNALEPEKVKTKIRTPKNFGKIGISDFDTALLKR